MGREARRAADRLTPGRALPLHPLPPLRTVTGRCNGPPRTARATRRTIGKGTRHQATTGTQGAFLAFLVADRTRQTRRTAAPGGAGDTLARARMRTTLLKDFNRVNKATPSRVRACVLLEHPCDGGHNGFTLRRTRGKLPPKQKKKRRYQLHGHGRHFLLICIFLGWRAVCDARLFSEYNRKSS